MFNLDLDIVYLPTTYMDYESRNKKNPSDAQI